MNKRSAKPGLKPPTWHARQNRNERAQRRWGTAAPRRVRIIQFYRFIKNAGGPAESLTAIRSHERPRVLPIRPRHRLGAARGASIHRMLSKPPRTAY